MSDEMMVQNKRPSAVPYLLTGAAIGGAAGAYSPIGVTKPRYESFEDLIAEKEDTFKKAKEKAKDDDVKKAFETVEKEKNAYKKIETDANRAIEEITEKNSSWAQELTNNAEAKKMIEELPTARSSVTSAKDELLGDIKAKITAGELEVPGMKAEESKVLTGDELTKKAEELLAKNKDKVKEKCGDKFTAFETAETALKNKLAALDKKAGELNVATDKMRLISEDGKKLIEAEKGKVAEAKKAGEKAVKEAFEKIKTPNKLVNGLILGTVLALGALALRPKAKENA